MPSFFRFAIGFSAALALIVLAALLLDVPPVWIMAGALAALGVVLTADLAKAPRAQHSARLDERIHER